MKKFLIFITLLLIAVCAGLLLFFQTDYAKNFVVDKAVSTIKEKTGWTVELHGVTGTFPFTLHVKSILLTDDAGPCIECNDITLQLSLQHLLIRSYVFDQIQASEMSIFRLPNQAKESPPSTLIETSEASLLELFLFPLKINLFQIGKLQISPAAIKNEEIRKLNLTQEPFALKGAISALPRSRLASIEMELHPLNDKRAETSFFIMCREIDGMIAGQLSINEAPRGLFSRSLPFNNPYKASSLIHFSYSQGIWESDFELSYLKTDPTLPELPFAGEKGKINGSATIEADQYKVQSLVAESEKIKVNGTIHLDGNGRYDGTAVDILFKNGSLPIEGFVEAEASLKGTIEDFFAAIQFHSPALTYEEITFNALSGALTIAKKTDTQIGTHLKIQSTLAGREVEMTLTADRLESTDWKISGFKIDSADNHLSGNFLFTSAHLLEGSFESTLTDLSLLKLYGSAAITGKFFPAADKQGLELLLVSPGIKGEQFRTEDATVSLHLANVWKEWSGRLNVDIRNLSSDGSPLVSVVGETRMDPSEKLQPFRIALQETNSAGVALETRGHWNGSKDNLLINVDELDGKVGSRSIKLENPASIRIESDRIDASPIFISIGEGSVYFSFDRSVQNFHMTSRLENIPLELLHYPLSGIVNADIFLYGPPHLPRGQMHLSWKNVKLLEEAFEKLPAVEGNFTAAFLENAIEGSAHIHGLTQLPMEATLHLPIALSLEPFKLDPRMDESIAVHLEGGGELAPILQLFLSDITLIHDETQFAIDLSGSLTDPKINGQATIRNGSFELLDSGAVFNQVQAKLEGKGKSFLLTEFSAQDDKGGKFFAKGDLELDLGKRFPFNLTVELQKSHLLRLDYAKGTLSGTMHFAGNADDSLLNGKLKMDSLTVRIPEQIPELTETVDIIYVNQPPNTKIPIYIKPQRSKPIRLDLTLDLPGSAQIKGKDLNSQWSGSVALTGTDTAPLFTGELVVDHGVYDFNGKVFDINKGTITFAGDIEKKTTLYVIASRDLGEIIAEVIVKGPIKHPSIAFRSNPPLSQREILSWLLFNRGMSDITPFQGEQLTQSITNLNQRQKGPDLLTKLRNSIGFIDRIDISRDRNSESNEMSLEVGKYISKGVYVRLNKSFGAEANRVGIEADLGCEMKVEASISDGEESDSQILLKWKHDY